jgi:hypothetical protein
MRALCTALALAALFACSDTTPTGGEVSDAAVEQPPARPLLPDAPAPGTGTTWSDLYRDIFSRGDAGSCTFKSFCHGNVDGTGYKAGLKCTSKDECRGSLFSLNLVNTAEPEKSFLLTGLLRAVRSGEVTGIMPKEPANYVFHPDTLKRIETWIREGAQNN